MNNNKKKIILLGTPQFASQIFGKLISQFNIVAIITQVDKSSGRKKEIIFSPVKQLAIKNNIKLFQPNKIKEIYNEIQKLKPDLILTCAYGQYVPEKILKAPTNGSLNIHGSLLPRHRGAAPIQYSILSGDEYAGLTLMKMEKEMDAGDMIFKLKTLIKNKTSIDLFNELAQLGSQNIVKWLNCYFDKKYKLIKQSINEVTYAPKIKRNDAQILSTNTVKEALLKIQAFAMWPVAFVERNNKIIKIFKATSIKNNDAISYELADGTVYLLEIQIPGKKRMLSKEFLKGNKIE